MPRESTGNNRRTYRSSDNSLALFCGIDGAIEHHDVAVVDAGERVGVRGRVNDNAAGFARVDSRHRFRHAVSGIKSDATDAALLAGILHTDAAARLRQLLIQAGQAKRHPFDRAPGRERQTSMPGVPLRCGGSA